MTRRLQKIYKFEATLPFEVRKQINLKANSYFMLVKLVNLSQNHVFLDTVNFQCIEAQKLLCINHNEGLFDEAVVFQPQEMRAYLF